MTRLSPPLAAGLGSAALLAAALAFQHLAGLAPCQLCLWQRWPHVAAVAVLGLWLALGGRALLVLGALAALASAGIGAFHMGVEYGWWDGLATCSANTLSGVSTEDLLNPAVDVAAPARCDKVAWSLAGLSMAGWNTVLSLGLAGLWLRGLRLRRQPG